MDALASGQGPDPGVDGISSNAVLHTDGHVCRKTTWSCKFPKQDAEAAAPALDGYFPATTQTRETPMSRHIAGHDLEYLATGSWILGTGGGGSPYSSYLSMKNYYDSGGRVELLDPGDLADDDLVAVLPTMGAPLVFQERMTDSAFALKPPRIMEEFLGQRFRAVMTVEIGGCNAFQPLLAAAASGKLLFLGKVIDVQRRTTEGFLRGTTRFAGLDGDAGSTVEIAFQNEFTVGWRDGSVAVTTPDLICVLDSVSGEAIGTESLRYGQRASVIALPSPQIHRTAKGLQHVGPRAFGYDIPFKSVFVDEQAELVA
jgi:DUF917 family protein